MKIMVPDYYDQFRCIAGECRHTCCVGWEIDVDEDSLARYDRVRGPLGEKLRENIDREGDCPHFRLSEEERCPFLNELNLCELYLELGEEALCQICADHPRFRNSFSDRTEIGLGLCCEAAVSLILERKEPAHLVELRTEPGGEENTPFETLVLTVRDEAVALVQDRSRPLEERVDGLMERFGVRMPDRTPKQWAELFSSLERLDSRWDRQLALLADCSPAERPLPELELPLEQLLVYFLSRRLPCAQDEADLLGCMAFAVLGYRVIRRLCLIREEAGGCRLSHLKELARLYSSEIEYSEENTNTLLDLLWSANARPE